MIAIRKLSSLVVAMVVFGAMTAAPHAVAQQSTPGAIGQSSSTTALNPREARRQCDDLLRRARQAMAENDLQAAETLLAQAESLHVEYSPLYPGDTPKKLRNDLQKRLGRSGGSLLSPGRLIGALLPGQHGASVPSDPFAAGRATGTAADAKTQAKALVREGRRELAAGNLQAAAYWYRKAAALKASFGPNEDSPARLAADILRQGGRLDGQSLGASGASTSGASLAQQHIVPLPPVDSATDPSGGAASRQAAQLLLEARRALAVGDVRRAEQLVTQARSLPVSYKPTDDNPDRVAADIAKYNDLMQQRAQRGHTEAFRNRYARILLEQCEGLLRHGDYGQAESLASLAARQGATFGPYEVSPQTMLERIASLRRQAGTPLSFSPTDKAQALALLRQARAALAAGDLARAEQLAKQAESLRVPDAAFSAGEDRPALVLLEIQKAMMQRLASTTGQVVPATGHSGLPGAATRALYDPNTDQTYNRWAGTSGMYGPNAGAPSAGQIPPGATSPARALFEQGEAALRNHDPVTAAQYFRQAAERIHELDPVTAQRLQDRLQMQYFGTAAAGATPVPPPDPSAAAQQQLFQRIAMELAQQESQAKSLLASDPKAAKSLMEMARKNVETAGLEARYRDVLLARADRMLAEIADYIETHQARIELAERNEAVREDIERSRQLELDKQERLAQLVEEFNQKMEEQRFAEAEVIAKRAAELDPTSPLAQQLMLNAKLVRRFFDNLSLQQQKEQGFIDQMRAVDLASVPFNDMVPYVFGDVHEWEALTKRRKKWLEDAGPQRSEQELEIERRLKTPVLLQFQNAPLSQVVDYLARMAGVNIHLDPRGLLEMGVTSEDPVTINLSQEISLRSALRLILEPLGLGYVIEDDVLKITSEQRRQGQVYTKVYNVADLVVPIPNFLPNTNAGLAGAYHDALGAVGFAHNGPFGMGSAPIAVVASKDGSPNRAIMSRDLLAQISSATGGAVPQTGTIPLGTGPGGLGGAALADFDSLIDLIVTTVAPTTWEEVGGTGTIAPFENQLSLVVSQTQDVHEQIADLLAQLRRMQDLQVNIEVRFITLNDNFFERIGVDFDFDIDDDIDRPFMVFGRPIDEGDPENGQEPLRNTLDVDHDNGSVTVGLQQPGIFSADLDIPFQQGSFQLAVPQFGGFDAAAGAQMGFAILSDIEAFFFINAAQGDRRSNVLQAPKVTLFNGQFATVSDTSSSPFVISVIPVVGDFAAAQQPVIVVLNEGTFLTVQAVVSHDKRFVRLTVVPFFSRIDHVDTFTFTGTETTIETSSQEGVQDEPNDNSASSSSRTQTRQGTTVQLPTFSYITVTTTVSVPDGGTVLLGGIKRLSEGRNEFGVPILNKLPYINRLFKNVGIGRETQSLMMMVTPRIIIQEEEEERLGLLPPE